MMSQHDGLAESSHAGSVGNARSVPAAIGLGTGTGSLDDVVVHSPEVDWDGDSDAASVCDHHGQHGQHDEEQEGERVEEHIEEEQRRGPQRLELPDPRGFIAQRSTGKITLLPDWHFVRSWMWLLGHRARVLSEHKLEPKVLSECQSGRRFGYLLASHMHRVLGVHVQHGRGSHRQHVGFVVGIHRGFGDGLGSLI
jgi:hypothetical protein